MSASLHAEWERTSKERRAAVAPAWEDWVQRRLDAQTNVCKGNRADHDKDWDRRRQRDADRRPTEGPQE